MIWTSIPGRMPPENPSVSNPLRVTVAGGVPGVGAGLDPGDGDAGFDFPQAATLAARITSAVYDASNRTILTMVAFLTFVQGILRAARARAFDRARENAFERSRSGAISGAGLASRCRQTDKKEAHTPRRGPGAVENSTEL